MRGNDALCALIASAVPLLAAGQGAGTMAEKLRSVTDYQDDVRFEVLLPSASDPVVYDINLQSTAAPADSLSPCDYVIRWTTDAPSGSLQGFSAYFDGSHYRYRNNRLQEYHIDGNPDVFLPPGQGHNPKFGVQWQAQFADLLPQFVGAKIQEIISDSAYVYKWHPDTLVSGQRAMVLDGVKMSKGYEVARYEYVFDHATGMPVHFDFENSPGSISEQIVEVTYSNASSLSPLEYSEEALMQEWLEEFERYRQSTFRAESLVGQPLPEFSCPIYGGTTRFNHSRGESLDQPLLIAVLDPSVATNAETIAAVREALQTIPMNIQVAWAFNSNHEREIAEIIGDVRDDEIVLTSAASLIRNCGITLFPTIMLVDSASKVADVIPGYNNDLSSIVIQKSMLLK